MNKEKNSNIVLMSAFLGSMMVYYDFIIYLLLSPILSQIFFNSTDAYHIVAINVIFAAGYIIRPVGGIIIAHFGDRISRRIPLLSSIFLMAISTVYIGTLPSYTTLGNMAPILLLILRLFQGIAIGAELPGGIALVYEHSPRNKKLFNGAFVFIGVQCGILMATCIFFLMNAILTPEEMLVWGWRPPFLLGAILTAIVWSLRFKVIDSPHFQRLKTKDSLLPRPFHYLIKNFKSETFISFMLVLGGFSIFISLFGLLLPNILISVFSYSVREAYCNNLLFTIFYVIFTLAAAYANQKFKFIRIKAVYAASIIVASCSFLLLPTLQSNSYYKIIPLYILITICLGIISSTIPSLISSLFPTQVRFSGIATSYNMAQAIGGGITPILINAFSNGKHVNSWISVLIISSSAILIFALVILSIKCKSKKIT
jgi:MFS family permease